MSANPHSNIGLELERARYTRFTSPLGGEGARLHLWHRSVLTPAPKSFRP